ncbi:hypothetical protein [Phenylobacterium sp.]|uniref:hypothetical protein n=1 Tax=Phenylobacterium sp. TaxID=1871053 RepID=UPI0035B4041F
MTRRLFWPAVLAAACVATAASAQSAAQSASQSVEVTPLAAPDLFSAGARDTGLSSDLWRGASADTMRAVLPLLAEKPLSPAARALALRVLDTGAAGPDGAGQDAELASLRIKVLNALGDAVGAIAVLSRTPNVEREPALAQQAAEAALLSGDDDRACQIGETLASGRGEIYWLRLRAYCRQRAGQQGEAQLTYDLAQGQDRDAVFGRLMGAKLAGKGDPGAASLRNGLDFALSRDLGLDLTAAKADPAVAAALAGQPPGPPVWTAPAGSSVADAAVAMLAAGDLAGARQVRAGFITAEPGVSADDLAVLDAMLAVASGQVDASVTEHLVDRAGAGEPAAHAKARAAAFLTAALGGDLSPKALDLLAGVQAAGGQAPAGRMLAMDLAAARKLEGQTALLALWTCAEAGAQGPSPADRARIARALSTAGLKADARNFVLEGLFGLQ